MAPKPIQTAETSPTSEPDFDNPECLCGIPGCMGHEDKGGFIEIPRLLAQLFFGAGESESGPDERAKDS